MGARYTIAGGHAGKDHLDVGCGGGHVSRELARRAGPSGSVVAIDLDATVLERAGEDAAADGVTTIEFRCDDATGLDESRFDVAYARFLLSHVGERSGVLAAMVAALRPGGLVIVEDTDFSGSFCHPPCARQYTARRAVLGAAGTLVV